MEKLLSCEAQFADENKFGFLDMTIPANPKTGQDATESLGGTFRRLNVDWNVPEKVYAQILVPDRLFF